MSFKITVAEYIMGAVMRADGTDVQDMSRDTIRFQAEVEVLDLTKVIAAVYAKPRKPRERKPKVTA
jgi:hypothetical protein